MAGPALAQNLAQDLADGQATYAQWCAVCHGAAAQGGGPMAPVLILQPTDLTRLAASNGGTFPTLRVVMRIDGRDPLVSHGSPMPLFGPFFEGSSAEVIAPDGTRIPTSQPVANLVAWLQGVQQ